MDRSERLRNLSPAKRMLLLKALQTEAVRAEAAKTISKRPAGEPALLSFGQRRLFFVDQLYPQTPAYNMPAAVRLRGPLQVPVLERSFNEEIRRHEILRTTFALVDGEPVQVVSPAAPVSLSLVDLSEIAESERESAAREFAKRDGRRPFDLARGPLVRLSLLRLSDDEHIIVLTMHHIISDAWSIDIFLRELSALYESYATARPSPLPELSIQYVDYAYWQRQRLQDTVLDRQLDYWKKQLSGATAIPELPTDLPRPAVQTYNGAQYFFSFDRELLEQVQALSRRANVTPFMLLLAVFKVLLYCFTGHPDVVVGSPVDNRQRVELEGMIGFFLNTLVLRTDLSGDPEFEQLLARVREMVLGSHAHQELPFETLVSSLQPERNIGRTLLFQVWFLYQVVPSASTPLSSIEMTGFPVDYEISHYDLRLNLIETPDNLSGAFECNADLFLPATITRFARQFEILTRLIVKDPATRLNELAAALREDEKERRSETHRQRKQANLDRLSNVKRRAIAEVV
ncbi:MAG TPA: condensation domain-containing protein [Pyrinomonadaceae bacterium]|nr:condensation domain-containing protein [Pyrinomonadaceae bacterium]